MDSSNNFTGDCEATFIVRVSKNNNQPWQGSVVWVTERCQQNFSSMQELFTLMDSTLNEVNETES